MRVSCEKERDQVKEGMCVCVCVCECLLTATSELCGEQSWHTTRPHCVTRTVCQCHNSNTVGTSDLSTVVFAHERGESTPAFLTHALPHTGHRAGREAQCGNSVLAI